MFLVTKYTVGSLATFITLAAISLYLLLKKKKAPSTWWLAGYFTVLSFLLLAYFLRYSIFSVHGAIVGYLANTIVFGVGCFMVFAYRLYEDPYRRERIFVTGIYFAAAFAVYGSNIVRESGDLLFFNAAAHYFSYDWGTRVSIVTALGFIWTIVVLFRRAGRSAGRIAASFRAFGSLAFVTFLISLLYLIMDLVPSGVRVQVPL